METAKILVMGKFSEWLMDRFVEWEKSQARRQSYSAFARYLGVKQASLSQWIIGNYVPTGENVKRLAEKLGVEIYDVLGLPRPDMTLEAMIEQYKSLPEELRAGFLPIYSEALRRYVAEQSQKHDFQRE